MPSQNICSSKTSKHYGLKRLRGKKNQKTIARETRKSEAATTPLVSIIFMWSVHGVIQLLYEKY